MSSWSLTWSSRVRCSDSMASMLSRQGAARARDGPSPSGVETLLEVVDLDDRPHDVEHQTTVRPDAILRVAAESASRRHRDHGHADEAETVERVEEVGASHDDARVAVGDERHVVRTAVLDQSVGALDD